MLPVYRIKWCCILLNDFLDVDSKRRDFANGISEDLKARQLEKAKSYLNAHLNKNLKWDLHEKLGGYIKVKIYFGMKLFKNKSIYK